MLYIHKKIQFICPLVTQHKQALILSPIWESEERTNKGTALKEWDKPPSRSASKGLLLHQMMLHVPNTSVPEHPYHQEQSKAGNQAWSPHQDAPG